MLHSCVCVAGCVFLCAIYKKLTVKCAKPFYTTVVGERDGKEEITISEMEGKSLSEILPFSGSCNNN